MAKIDQEIALGRDEKDPYVEIENYLRKAQEEISAVFNESGSSGFIREEKSRVVRTSARPPLLDGQASPSKIRKVYADSRPLVTPPPPPPQRQFSVPSYNKKRIPLTRKSRRVSAPTLISPESSHNGHPSSSNSSADPWHPRKDSQIHEWAQGLLKDFHSLVEEEIRSLGKNTPTTSSTPCLGTAEITSRSENRTSNLGQAYKATRHSTTTDLDSFSISHSIPAKNYVKADPISQAGLSPSQPHESIISSAYGRRKCPRQNAWDSCYLLRPPSGVTTVGANMGSAQSTGRDTWSGERTGPFKTYTLPRSGGHRSVSLSGTGAINYRTSAAHPDDLDDNCELLRVNPRFSRSHSLDEGAGLSSWAIHHLSVIDGIHGKATTPASSSTRTSQGTLCPKIPQSSEPQRIPAPPPSTPRSGTSTYLNEGHYGKIRKTGYSETHNERWRPVLVNSCHVDSLSNGASVIGTSVRSSGDSVEVSKKLTDRLAKTSNGSTALSPSDLQKGKNEPWPWADQEDVCSLTDRSCDPNECHHCQAKNMDLEEEASIKSTSNQVKDCSLSELDKTFCENATELEKFDSKETENVIHLTVSPPDVSTNYQDNNDLEITLTETRDVLNESRSSRKSEPAMTAGIVSSSTPVDGRRHTLPVPRLFGSLSLLSAPVPTFDTSSWETLPPADELDFELEEKPIASTTKVRDPSPGSLSAGSSHSLNSSLSSLSHLSIHAAHSECDSWPSSPVADQVLSPEIFLDPLAFPANKDSNNDCHHEDGRININNNNKDIPSDLNDKDMVNIDKGNHSKEAIHKISHLEPITGMLHLTPTGTAGGGEIIFSVSIPEESGKSTEHQRPISTKLDGAINVTSDSVDEVDNLGLQITQSKIEQNGHGVSPNNLCSEVNKLSIEDKISYSNAVDKPKIEFSTESKKVECSSQTQWIHPEENAKMENAVKSLDVRKPPQRQRSISLTEPPTSLVQIQNKRLITKSTQSQQPGALSHFLKAVENHMRESNSQSYRSPGVIPSFGDPGQPLSTSSTPSSTPSSSAPTVVLDAFTQTTPTPTPQSQSRASSVTWLSECGCDDLASIEPCASSLALSVTEDDYGDDDEEDDDDDDWSEGVSLSSSSPPPTPGSMVQDDSSFSLSESLDTLDMNVESGIGTVSTRPSVSPPSHAHHALDLSGSNLSSEDTGLENSFERQIRRYIPNNRSGRESDHSQHYRRRRPKPRHHEQWVRREDQMTQTDPHPPSFTLGGGENTPSNESLLQDSNETLERSRGGSEERMVRHTHSEPHLDASLTPLGGSLRGVYSETALPPIPTSNCTRNTFTPSAPFLPTLTEDKPPIAPINSKPRRPRHLSLSASQQPPHTPGKACSAPALESRQQQHQHQTHHVYTQHTPATTPSEDSSGETPAMTTRSQSAKELAELEAIEACKWLRAAGFPQYAQMYEDLQFPLDLVSVERDHSFLDQDSLQALFRRLRALNKCAKIRLDSARKNKAEESDDEEQQCALSGNWKYVRQSRRWSRIVLDRSPTVGNKGGEHGRLEIPEDALLGQFKRSGSERIRDGAKALFRRVESFKNSKKKKKQNRDGVVISGPKLINEAHVQARVAQLGCVDISPEVSPELSARGGTVTTSTPHVRDVRQSTPGEDSSSLASDQSQSSTPLFRGRRRRKFWPKGSTGHMMEGGGGGGAYSDSECSPPTWRHCLTDANSNKMAPISNQVQAIHPEKQPSKGSSGRQSKPGQLRHTGSLTYGKESQAARENFLSSIRAGGEKSDENVSPMPSPDEERHSLYDNVPIIICNKGYHDFQSEIMDSASAHEGSGSSECTVESRDSPLPSAHEEEEVEEPRSSPFRITIDRWHSFNGKAYQPSTKQQGTQINGFSSGQMLHLRKRALLRLTALMERYCPSNRSGWNWELPKFMRKIKTPDYRDRQVFGVPLLVIAQRTGQPLPPGIQAALQYLRTSSLDQVGIFRKPGVRSRIQKLRDLHELGEEIQYSSFGVCDIADMVKTYFRELPEVLLTNKLSEMFIAIFQYLPVEHRLEALQCAVLLLPDENREVLMALLTFLADVAANSHLNQMHASNLAVCLAPSLFHLNVGTSGSSPLRRRAGGTPEQRDLHENKAAHQCLTLMIQQVSQLQCVPTEMLANCRFTYLEQSQPVCLEDLGTGSPSTAMNLDGGWASYMNDCISALLKEARDKSRGWVHMNCGDSNVEILYRKVGDGLPLRLWRATTEVEAPPSELLNRVIRERHLWDDSLLKWRVVTHLDRQAQIFQYMCNSMAPRPPVDYCVLRCWRSELARGTCVLVETSVEHSDAPVLVGGVRGIVLASRYLIQPCGSGKSRITHISRVDMRGRTPEWYNKVYGHATATHLTRIRQSFEHHACGPESKV